MKLLLPAIASILLILLATGCLRQPTEPLRLQDHVIKQNSRWSGTVLITGRVEVQRGVRLTIAPGSDIRFVYQDTDRDGFGDSTLAVNGELVAIGTPQQPIRFRSARSNPQPGDWLEIAVDFAKNLQLRYCELRDSAYTLHAHFTRGVVEDCHIHHNIDGCRIGQASFVLQHNLIEENRGKAINFRNSRVQVRKNLIRNNGAGIFLFENDRPFEITGNHIVDNRFQLRLGDFYQRDISLRGNWWGTADLAQIYEKVYDRRADPGIGSVTLKPAIRPFSDVGPRPNF